MIYLIHSLYTGNQFKLICVLAVMKQLSYAFLDISKELAQEISNSDYRSLKRLCQGIISTLKPSVPDMTLIELLNENEDTNAKLALQTIGVREHA